MKKITGIVFGALLVASGVIYILGAFGIADINISLDGWWTLFIIIPCLNGVLTDKDKTGSLVGLAVGVMLLLAAQDVFEYDMIWKLIVPVVIIVLGIKMIEKAVGHKPKDCTPKQTDTEEHAAVFGSKNIDYTDKELTVAKIAAFFGGAKCNLKEAKILDGSQVDLMCAFGGADIIVPENVNIKINTFCLFGGISDKRNIKSIPNDAITLNINGFCFFGGADIK